MEKFVIRHLSGARADQVEEFPSSGSQEWVIGRDDLASVKFDPDRDDLVSRQHAKIIRDASGTDAFQLVDLQSRNGTFLNHTRVYGAVRLSHEDVVQLGAGGPEFRFEIFPPPEGAASRPTREAPRDLLTGLDMRSTREGWAGVPNGPRPVGRGTVERMLGDVFVRVKRESNRSLWVGLMALIAILAVGAVIWLYIRRSQSEQLAAARENAASLQQVSQQVQQTPADVNELRGQIARLEEQLKASGERTEASATVNRQLLSDLRQRLDTATRALAANQQQQAPQAVSQTAPPAAAAAPPPAAQATFDSLLQQATQLSEHGRTKEAFDLVNTAISKDDKRWEAYELGGRLATALDRFPEAATMYQRALPLAPESNRADLQTRLDEVRRRMETR